MKLYAFQYPNKIKEEPLLNTIRGALDDTNYSNAYMGFKVVHFEIGDLSHDIRCSPSHKNE